MQNLRVYHTSGAWLAVRKSHFAWQTWLVALCLGSAAAVVSMQHSERIPAELVTNRRALNLWFEGDLPYVYSSMSDRADSHHRRSRRHLLFPMVSYPPAKLLRALVGLDPLQAVRVTMAALSFVWAALLFLLLSLLGCAVLDGALFCLLAIVSAAALFWLSVPESWAFGSTSFLAALAITAWRQHRSVSERWLTLGSALTLSMTTSNWMMGGAEGRLPFGEVDPARQPFPAVRLSKELRRPGRDCAGVLPACHGDARDR